MDAQQVVVKKNYEAFVKLLPSILETHRGKFALMHEAAVVEYFDTMHDAYVAGRKLYPDGRFSIQEVTEVSADLGYFSHAVPH